MLRKSPSGNKCAISCPTTKSLPTLQSPERSGPLYYLADFLTPIDGHRPMAEAICAHQHRTCYKFGSANPAWESFLHLEYGSSEHGWCRGPQPLEKSNPALCTKVSNFFPNTKCTDIEHHWFYKIFSGNIQIKRSSYIITTNLRQMKSIEQWYSSHVR